MAITIIAGKLKGRKLRINSEIMRRKEGFRPILARIRKSVFDILRNKIGGSLFLDLYAGSGTVGIEAISRGAKHVVFIDNDMDSIDLINKNVKEFKIDQLCTVIKADILKGLSFLKRKIDYFDIIFLGPPYDDMVIDKTIHEIISGDILKYDGWIVAQHHMKEKVSPVSCLTVFRQEKYGDSVVSFLKKL